MLLYDGNVVRRAREKQVMAVVLTANGSVLTGQTLEGVLLAALSMVKVMETAGHFREGESARLTLQIVNGLLSFNGTMKLESSFDSYGNLVETAVPYLDGNVVAPNVNLQQPPPVAAA